MPVNMGTLDRVLRTIAALLLLWLAFAVLAGVAKWLAIVVAIVFLATSAMKSCPLYTLLGVRTCRD